MKDSDVGQRDVEFKPIVSHLERTLMLFAVQHLNDFSGSPLILRQRLSAQSENRSVTLVTNQGSGFLDDVHAKVVRFPYHKHESMVMRFLSLSVWYLRVSWFLIAELRPGDRLVCATILSSPLLWVLLVKRGVEGDVYINEVSFNVPGWRVLGKVMCRNERVRKVYLSRFVRDAWKFRGDGVVSYPKLRDEVLELARSSQSSNTWTSGHLRFFLVCSHIPAKGYRLFIEVARYFHESGAQHSFALFLNGDRRKFEREYPSGSLPSNLTVEFNNTSPRMFCGQDVFLGLTDPSLWVETFGLTFAEAMCCGAIVVVPSVGAQLEYVADGVNGFVLDDYSLSGVLSVIARIEALADPEQIRANARATMSRLCCTDAA